MNGEILTRYSRILRSRWRCVAWAVVLTLTATALPLLLLPPRYITTATVFVRTPGDVSQAIDGGDTYAQLRAETYAALARNTAVSARVIADLGLGIAPEQLSQRISGRHIGNTVLFEVTVSAPSGREARRTAEVLLSELSSQVNVLETVPGSLVPRAELVVVDPPGSVRRVVAGGAPLSAVVLGAVVLGVFLGAVAAVLREILGTEQIQQEAI